MFTKFDVTKNRMNKLVQCQLLVNRSCLLINYSNLMFNFTIVLLRIIMVIYLSLLVVFIVLDQEDHHVYYWSLWTSR